MTKEQIKAKAKEHFPNDEFKQQAVIDAINWATKELQETNNELKGKLVLSDMVLTDKTKRIKELEQESEYYHNRCKDCALELSREKLKDLEKENAELKESLKKWKDAIYADVENYDDQLTKAKELLLKLSTCLEGHSNNNFEYELIKEAEQFISEVEK